MGKAEDHIEALLTPPPSEDPESQRWVLRACHRRWWSDERYKVGSLTGEQQAAAVYLDHIKNAPGWAGWILSHALVRVMKENSELIVMAARMKKLMLED